MLFTCNITYSIQYSSSLSQARTILYTISTYFLTYLHRHYIELFNEELGNCEEVAGNFTPHNLEDKINKVFTKDVKFLMCQNKKLLVPKHVSVIDEKLLELAMCLN